MASEPAASPKKSGFKGLMVLVLLAVFAVGAGAALPWLLAGGTRDPGVSKNKKKSDAPKAKPAAIPFGDVAVNLREERLSRYLRVKLMVAVEESDAKEIADRLTNHKAFLKSWLISYLSDQAPADVSRKEGVNRIRREVRDHFNAVLYPDGEERIVEILFDEFVVQ